MLYVCDFNYYCMLLLAYYSNPNVNENFFIAILYNQKTFIMFCVSTFGFSKVVAIKGCGKHKFIKYQPL